MKGKIYGVGVGPGDPQLMTLKAVHILEEVAVVAFPGESPQRSQAFGIALGAVPSLETKELLPLSFPMTREEAVKQRAIQEAAKQVASHLDRGEDVACLTLGDPALYSTFGALAQVLTKEGYESEMVSAVPSFCAAAASLKVTLAAGEEALVVLPASRLEEFLASGKARDTSWVILKAGQKLGEVKDLLRKAGKEAQAVTWASCPEERVYEDLDQIPDEAGYFTLVVSRDSDGKERG